MIKVGPVVFWIIGAITLSPWISAPIALLLGFLMASLGWVPQSIQPSVWVKKLLALAIVALGFGVQINVAWQVTSDYFGLMVTSIVVTLCAALLLGRLLKVDSITSHLLGSGTAICGGSAIAAVAPAVHARNDQIALALASVFTLNAVALLIFPLIGRALALEDQTFGAWAAIAIHDTSSVVGAAQAYSDEALQTATTLKLARALWIVPLALLSALVYQRFSHTETQTRVKIPLFIIGYVVAMLVSSAWPQFHELYSVTFGAGKSLLVFCLYLVGASITVARLKAAGPRPLLLAVVLWLLIATLSLAWLTIRTG
ncbi:putative sulfate exporter family transporter [Pseudidiomarina gelatinasegens]|uniref:Putative sulfate exporter family transporter n=1 Tax=Pseudidiomarina gelatinasegens TaxID=2487740 RepID=A0A443YZ81_9GAMM|nr:putative sulfate exporter family transporter [Pseudidiomarina gelatinasegens]RWU09515.1 putative sulfate exporter family transporter [Pseudidiomarina gelatinasegens]